VEPLLLAPAGHPREWPEKHPRRDLVNGILYVVPKLTVKRSADRETRWDSR
jgi:hypothetical protein